MLEVSKNLRTSSLPFGEMPVYAIWAVSDYF
jgi:hypothetical protein